MDNLRFLIGEGTDLTALQMTIRAIGMFFIALVLIRIGGMRIFGHESAFDSILVILLGAILARAVVGASPYFATVAAAAAITIIHRVLGWIACKNITVGKLIKGEHIPLYENSEFKWKNMRRCSISEGDLLESLRLQTNQNELLKVEKAIMETNGHISFILKKE